MSLRKRGRYWHTRFTVGGQTVEKSTGHVNKQKAQEYEDALRTQLRNQQRYGWRSWDDAGLRWLTEKQDKRSLNRDKSIMKWLMPHLSGKWLHDITPGVIQELRELSVAETSRENTNRRMALLRSILRACVNEWEWLAKAPKVPMYPKKSVDYRWLESRAAFRALLKELPSLTQQLARFAVATGCRRTECTHLEWSRVDLGRRLAWVVNSQAKNGKARSIPLSTEAIAVLREQWGQSDRWVFPQNGKRVKKTLRGLPMNQVATKAWRAAVRRSGAPDGFRFHDLRHTWASWHVQAGTPLQVLMELGGWSSLTMVLRYAHLNSDHLQSHADALGKIGGNGESSERLKAVKS